MSCSAWAAVPSSPCAPSVAVGAGPSPEDTPRTVSSVDGDPAAAVTEVLREVLEDRSDHARSLDPRFAEHVAGTLADFALSGASRRRAALVWWGWRACGGGAQTVDRGAARDTDRGAARDEERPPGRAPGAEDGPGHVLRVAAALELIQCCALIHDDLMDGSPRRRGGPAVHVRLAAGHEDTDRPAAGVPPAGAPAPFGWSAAVLVGDLALAWADDLLAETGLTGPTRAEVQALWREMRTEMVAGQYLDLAARPADAGSGDDALGTAVLKSGSYSVERPLSLGAALAAAPPDTRRTLRSVGRAAGLAFQLRDDQLGVFGDTAVTGKPSGDDIRQGKATHLVALALRRARRRGDRHALRVLGGALGNRELSPAGLDEVRAVLADTGACAAVEQRIADLVAACAVELRSARLDPAARDRLLDVLHAAAGGPVPRGPR
ncbi:putative geranylgeranyl pyrophosphate synthase [Actinacidiphila reveromycinica]|uniref:Putative geranylgeranyl pyrophosphate synthase n=1 Tax=Actinacidiphila reveromycinica TaxID=659352 RepID=A0A7U3UMS3_9ACTN|nr:polyprenyl synthetase family protein [Streptomyces sp. SN-593]BBA95438.1 putative geranylgeranyl pyrophosphate synthase [Streptomyces sp. SN-593]